MNLDNFGSHTATKRAFLGVYSQSMNPAVGTSNIFNKVHDLT
jgi:hypothetical protein